MPGRKTPAFNSYASLQAMLPLLNLPLTSLGLSGPSWEGCKGEEFASPGVGGHSPENDSLRSLSPKLLSSGLPFTQQNKQLSSGLPTPSGIRSRRANGIVGPHSLGWGPGCVTPHHHLTSQCLVFSTSLSELSQSFRN